MCPHTRLGTKVTIRLDIKHQACAHVANTVFQDFPHYVGKIAHDISKILNIAHVSLYPSRNSVVDMVLFLHYRRIQPNNHCLHNFQRLVMFMDGLAHLVLRR